MVGATVVGEPVGVLVVGESVGEEVAAPYVKSSNDATMKKAVRHRGTSLFRARLWHANKRHVSHGTPNGNKSLYPNALSEKRRKHTSMPCHTRACV
eukprot:9472502-Pyramimonas_sp.AAC.1